MEWGGLRGWTLSLWWMEYFVVSGNAMACALHFHLRRAAQPLPTSMRHVVRSQQSCILQVITVEVHSSRR
eukprot:652083-Pelagomonas_calceolata.AAC.2